MQSDQRITNTIMQMSLLLKKMDTYEAHVDQALAWIENEIKNPTPQPEFSMEEKLKRLNESKSKTQDIKKMIIEKRAELKDKMKDNNLEIITEVAEFMKLCV